MESEKYVYGRKIKALSGAFNRILNASCAAMELTCSQGMVLGYLAHHQDVSVYPRDLERFFNLSHATVSGLLQRLESKGLITFTVAPQDHRCKCVALTQKALERDQIQQDAWDAANEQMVQGFSAEERRLFWELLSRAAENMTTQKEEKRHDKTSAGQCTGV